jgi:hypothetical protein
MNTKQKKKMNQMKKEKKRHEIKRDLFFELIDG